MERVLSWALGLTLATLLLVIAFLQLAGPSPDPVFGMLAARTHIWLVEPYGRYLVVLFQLIATVLVLHPLTRPSGALLALALALGAIVLHLTPLLGVELRLGSAVSRALAQGRSPADIDAMTLPTDRGGMFLLALSVASLAAGTLFVYNKQQVRNFRSYMTQLLVLDFIGLSSICCFAVGLLGALVPKLHIPTFLCLVALAGWLFTGQMRSFVYIRPLRTHRARKPVGRFA